MVLWEIFSKTPHLASVSQYQQPHVPSAAGFFPLYSVLFTALSALLVDVHFLLTYQQRQLELELSDFAELLRLFQQLTFT